MRVQHQQSRQVGQRIAQMRHRQRLSTRELAQRLGWPRDTLVNFEHGRRAITIERLDAIAQALDVAPAVLLLDDDRLRDLLARLRAEPGLVDQITFFLTTLDDELPGASGPS